MLAIKFMRREDKEKKQEDEEEEKKEFIKEKAQKYNRWRKKLKALEMQE